MSLPSDPQSFQPSEADYASIAEAVMETARGRWFLGEYAKRNRNSDTDAVLAALSRLEEKVQAPSVVAAEGSVDRFKLDLVEMATAIARTKAELASIKPDLVQNGKIGTATEELDIIVATTEVATQDILGAAETIQEIAWTLREQGADEAVCDLLDTRATEIYTACSFQDLTGQRTKKVVEVLRYLENRINAVIGIWGLEGSAQATAASVSEEDALLNGPAKPGTGLEQSDVDGMMFDQLERYDPETLDLKNLIDEQGLEPQVLEPVTEEVVVGSLVVMDAPDIAPETDDVAGEEVPVAEPVVVVVSEQDNKPEKSHNGNPFAAIDALGPEEKIALFS